MAVRAAVEALLRERKLDRTLTSTLPERLGEDAVAPFDISALDRGLAGWASPQETAAGGLPRGQVSEVVGPASSGRTSVAWAALAAATRRGESVALIDTFDRFDPPTAHACGVELSRLLWVRGQAVSKTSAALDPAWLPGVRAVSGPGTFVERVIDRAIKSLNLVVQSGVCTLVVIDLIDVPATALRRLPASTWFRVERAIEGSDTAVLILAAMPVARSAGGRSIALDGNGKPGTGNRESHAAPGSRLPVPVWRGSHDRSRRIAGVRGRASINAARWSHAQPVDLETHVINEI
jgi:recombination protein RecA